MFTIVTNFNESSAAGDAKNARWQKIALVAKTKQTRTAVLNDHVAISNATDDTRYDISRMSTALMEVHTLFS